MFKRILATIVVCVLLMPLVSDGSPVFQVNFDMGAQNPAPGTYTAGSGDVIPAGVVGTKLPGGIKIVDSSAGALQGGQAMEDNLGAAWPDNHGYTFSDMPTISAEMTIEVLVKPEAEPEAVPGPESELGPDVEPQATREPEAEPGSEPDI